MKALIFSAILGSGSLTYNNFTSTDAYAIYPAQNVIAGAEPVLDRSGRTQVICNQPGVKTAVVVVVGQSLSVNESPTAYTPSGNVDQLDIFNGNCYKAKDPLLGINVSGGVVTDQRGTWMSRFGDKLLATGKFDRVVIVPMAVGNTSIAQWSNNSPPYLFNKINIVGLRLRDAGLQCTAIMWGQGESDTSLQTTQANYAASLNRIIAEYGRSFPGCPVLVAQESYYYGATNLGVLAAQASVVNGTTVFAGENVDSIPAAQRYDNTHLNDAGVDTRANLAVAALLSALGL